MNKEQLREEIINVLKTVYDPEIPVDIYELGLIYTIYISDEANVHIRMTLTSPNCPVAESMPNEVKQKVAAIEDVKSAEIELVWEPIWTRDMMSDEARIELNLF